jgi:hypothetical protein
MQITFNCPNCGKAFSRDSELAGKRARCKDCATVFTIPPLAAPAAPRQPKAAPAPEPESYELVFEPRQPAARPDRKARAGGATPEWVRRARMEAQEAMPEEGSSRQTLGAVSKQTYALVGAIGALVILIAIYFLSPASNGLKRAVLETVGSGAGLDPDELPDDELDRKEGEPVRADRIAKHEKVLKELAAANDQLTDAFKGVRDAQTMTQASPAVEAAAKRLEAIGASGNALPKLNATEAGKLHDGAVGLVRESIMRQIQQFEKLGQIRAFARPAQKMLQSSRLSLSQIDIEYPAPPPPMIGLTITNVENADVGAVIQAKLDAAIPADQRRSVQSTTDGNAKILRIKLGPIADAQTVASKITFGKVTRVHGRRIKVIASPPSEADLAAARAKRAEQERTVAAAVPEKRDQDTMPPAAAPEKHEQENRAPAAPIPARPSGERLRSEMQGWTVLFRGRNPRAWNTKSQGETAAVPLSEAPADMKYLCLRRLDTNEAFIMPLTRDQLGKTLKNGDDRSAPYRWCGTNEDHWGGRHLGIGEGPLRRGGDTPYFGKIAIQVESVDCFLGSGFGHEHHGDGRTQHFGWRGEKIQPTDFEISVSAGPLSDEEKRCLIGLAP